MENRNMQGRTLLPHQRKIWTEAFKASMHHTSIESAERKAWQAVDICERVGAFGEVSQTNTVELPNHVVDWEAAWSYLGTALWDCSKSPDDWENRVASAMRDYAKSEMELSEFKEEIDLLFRDPSE